MLLITQKLIKRILRYAFFIALLGRILVSIYIGYQYVWFSSDELSSKGGTFVEGIFDSTSYLPYLRNDVQSSFYQGLLFNSCLTADNSGNYVPDLCDIQTTDNETYTIALKKGPIRSDGTPVSLNDLYFTYNDIIRGNKWNITQLDVYKDIVVLKDTDNKLRVTFPTASQDNNVFFATYILPQHILQDYDVDNYTNLFGKKPVYTNCANLVADSVDPYSLIFNLVDCPDTNLNFYQVKNALSFENFQKNPSSMVDAYIGTETLNGYAAENLLTNKLVTVFFNTKSDKLNVRVRRVLGGLIKHNFYTTGYASFMEKNNDGLFDVFQSTGADAKDLINRDYSTSGNVTKADLLDINVQSLPKNILITGENQKLIYFIETGTTFPISLTLDKAYDSVSIEYKGKSYSPLSYSRQTKVAGYTIGGSTRNFGSGLNKYTIYGYVKKQKNLVASLDIYNVTPNKTTQSTDTGNKIQLTVIYYDSPLYNFVVERMQRIFQDNDVLDNFTFEKITTPEELQGRLLAGDYDILVSVVDMGAKGDITKLFGTDNSQFNPSQYQNQKMITLLQQYMQDHSSKELNDINAMYSKDMPFVILGKVFSKLNIKPVLADKLFGSGSDTSINESNRRSMVYQKLKLETTIHIDGTKVWSRSNFMKFLEKGLK